MKKFLTILLIFALCITLCGCYDSKEISRIAFIIAVGFDEDSYSFQIVKPSAFESEGSEDSPLLTTTVSAPNVYIAMDKLNSAISEKCDYSHIKMVMFSQDKMKKGIESEVDAMLKSNDFHPNTRVAMCEGKASEYMKDMKIPLDANPAEYYENIFKQNYTEYAPDTKLKDLQKNYKTHVTGNVFPIINKNGMAITKNYKLTDIADTDDVLLYNILKQNNFEGNYPIDNSAVINLRGKNRRYNVDMSGTSPVISVKIKLEGDIIWAEENLDKTNLGTVAKEQIKNKLTEFLNRCSINYKADIFDFYKYARTNYITIQNWENENWQGLFEKASYNVTIDIDVKREGLNIN